MRRTLAALLLSLAFPMVLGTLATAADFPVLERKDCAKDPRVTGKCRWVYGDLAVGANGLCYVRDFASKKLLSAANEPDYLHEKDFQGEEYCYVPLPVRLTQPMDLSIQGRFLFCPMANYHDFLGWDRWDEAGCIARIEDGNVFRLGGNLTNPPWEFLMTEYDHCPHRWIRGQPCEGP